MNNALNTISHHASMRDMHTPCKLHWIITRVRFLTQVYFKFFLNMSDKWRPRAILERNFLRLIGGGTEIFLVSRVNLQSGQTTLLNRAVMQNLVKQDWYADSWWLIEHFLKCERFFSSPFFMLALNNLYMLLPQHTLTILFLSSHLKCCHFIIYVQNAERTVTSWYN